jgi:hypothetical protein
MQIQQLKEEIDQMNKILEEEKSTISNQDGSEHSDQNDSRESGVDETPECDRDPLNPKRLRRLGIEVEIQWADYLRLRSNCDDLSFKIRESRSEMKGTSKQEVFKDISIQKTDIADLRTQVQSAVEKHRNLKRELREALDLLTDPEMVKQRELANDKLKDSQKRLQKLVKRQNGEVERFKHSITNDLNVIFGPMNESINQKEVLSECNSHGNVQEFDEFEDESGKMFLRVVFESAAVAKSVRELSKSGFATSNKSCDDIRSNSAEKIAIDENNTEKRQKIETDQKENTETENEDGLEVSLDILGAVVDQKATEEGKSNEAENEEAKSKEVNSNVFESGLDSVVIPLAVGLENEFSGDEKKETIDECGGEGLDEIAASFGNDIALEAEEEKHDDMKEEENEERIIKEEDKRQKM